MEMSEIASDTTPSVPTETDASLQMKKAVAPEGARHSPVPTDAKATRSDTPRKWESLPLLAGFACGLAIAGALRGLFADDGAGSISLAVALAGTTAVYSLRYLDTPSRRTSEQDEKSEPATHRQDSLIKALQSIYVDSAKRQQNGRASGGPSRDRQFIFRALVEDSRRRILDEIRSQTRRSNLNLAIGMFITLIALSSLGWMFFNSEQVVKTSDPWPSLAVRFAFVFFVEVFAFFFLRLYRSGLAEIKYFQNELTNIELKVLALEAAIHGGDEKAVEVVIAGMVYTDRNPQLSAGNSTVELEQKKLIKAETSTVLEQMSALVTAINKSNK